MEKWKIGVIALLVAGLAGFSLFQNSPKTPESLPTSPSDATPKPNPLVGKTALSAQLPEWDNVTLWANVKAGQKPPTLASLGGQVALVEVFRIKCGHCSDAAPFMEKLYERYAPRGLKMVALQSPGDFKNLQNPETQWSEVKKWLSSHGAKYPVGQDSNSEWFQGKVKGMLYPTMMLFGKEGTVQFAQTGFDAEKSVALAVAVEKLLPSSEPLEKRAANLAKWLGQFLQNSPDSAFEKAFTDDIQRRLQTP